MGRLNMSRGIVIALTPLLLAACTSTTPSEKTWEEIRAERVKDFMLHLNNDSKSERWRDGLIEVGKKSVEDRDFLLQQLEEAYEAGTAEIPADIWRDFEAEFGVGV